jgi:hypothetical protein
MKVISVVAFATLLTISISARAELVQQFKNPAFNGQGWSSHALTIDSIEKSRRDQIEADRKAAIAKSEAELMNTPLNRFISLFQSQVYAQISTQLSNNLFQNRCAGPDGTAVPGCVNPTTGTFTLDGNTITWRKESDKVVLTVVDAKGTVTTVTVPIASFGF